MKQTKPTQAKRPTRAKKITRHKAKLVLRRNRPVHKRILLHPITVFTMLCVGVFIVMWTFKAAADSYKITAKVSAAPLLVGAEITQPTEGATFTSSPILIKGTCPDNSYIVLFRNNTMSGSSICAVDNTFVVETGLYPGTNTLKAQAYNLTDDVGPSTNPVNISYNPLIIAPVSPAGNSPQTTTNTPANTSGSPTQADQPLISSEYTYQTFAAGSLFEWSIELSGGKAPYRVDTAWGDGSFSTQSVPSIQRLVLSHTYKKPGNYTVKINLTDANGAKSFLQIVAIIRIPGTLLNGGSAGSTAGTEGNNTFLGKGILIIAKHWLAFAWASYAVVLLMTISFWLGERQQLAIISAHKNITKRRHRA